MCRWPGFVSRSRPGFPSSQQPPGSRGGPAHSPGSQQHANSLCNSGFWGNSLRARSLLSPQAGARGLKLPRCDRTGMWWQHQHHQLFCNQLLTAPGTELPNVPPKIRCFLGKEDTPDVSPKEHSLSATWKSGVLWVLFVLVALGFIFQLLVCN